MSALSPGRRRLARVTASAALAFALLAFALPKVTGTEFSGIAAVIERLSVLDLLALFAVWCLTLAAYTWVLTSTLPGLTHPQALTVNVTSSAASNLLPFGGAVGLGLSWAITRSWGFTASAFGLSALVTGIWNVLAKLALPSLGLLALLIGGDLANPRLAAGAGVAMCLLLFLLATFGAALSHERVAITVGRVTGRAANLGLRLVRSRRTVDWQHQVPHLRTQTRELLRTGWLGLSLGMAGFLGAQAFLQWLALHLLGSTLSPTEVFAGFAFGRLLTSLVITPGGLGISETGAAGLLIALGGERTVTTSGVLLFSAFVFFLEIPAGALGYLTWLTRRSWRADPAQG